MTIIPATPQNSTAHFAGLDGLRGVAAMVVVLYHVCLPLHVVIAVKGYLAVDLFFLLSGFVIANAYEDRLQHGMDFGSFVRVRLLRLYPLCLLGMIMGIAVSFVKAFDVLTGTSFLAFAVTAVMGLFMIPFGHLQYSTSTLVFPFDGPAWSLLIELAVNFAYALILARLSQRCLYIIVVLSFALLAFATVLHGNVDMGGELETFLGGLVRTAFSFFAGVLLYRLVKSWLRVRVHAGGKIAGLALLIILVVPFKLNAAIFDLTAVLIAFPLIILLAAEGEPIGRWRSLALRAGALSYPLYVTHYPIMRVFQFFAEKRQLSGATLYGMIMLEIVLMVAAAQLALSLYDRPVQAFFKRRFGTGRVQPHSLAGPLSGR